MDTVANFYSEQDGCVTAATVLSVLYAVCVTKLCVACMLGVRAVPMEAILPICRSGGKSTRSALLAVDTYVNTASCDADATVFVLCPVQRANPGHI